MSYSLARILAAKRDTWSPYLIPRSLMYGLLDAELTSTLTDDGGGAISAWKDVITGQNFTAATTARPTLGAASFSGCRPGLTFDGTANNMRNTSTQAWPLTGAMEAWMLVDSLPALGSLSTTPILLEWPASTSAKRFRVTRGSTNDLANASVGNGSANVAFFSPSTTVDGIHIWRIVADGANGWIEIDGVAAAPKAVVPALDAALTRNTIGASGAATAANFANICLSFLMITKRLPDATAQQVYRYLRGRF